MTISEAIKMLDVLYVLDAPNLAQAINMTKDALREKKAREENPQGRWISVEDKMPDEEGEYLFYTDWKEIFVCGIKRNYDDPECWTIERGCSYTGNITHWMPLPEAPEEENQ